MTYTEDDYLPLSGIQHFLFCRRQWALIHIENQWAENVRTVEGQLLHKNAHDPEKRTIKNDILTVRALRIHSSRLGFSGECDVTEFHRDPDGIALAGEDGLWKPYPVEYKRGTPKAGPCDKAQLCAQAMCLEEMLCCEIPEAALYYGEPRHRLQVPLTPELRQLVEKTSQEMHDLYRRGHTPKAKRTKSCNACSLKDLCLPKLMHSRSVSDYMREEGGIESSDIC